MGQGKIGFGKCVLLTVISQILMIGLACVLMFCFRGQSIGISFPPEVGEKSASTGWLWLWRQRWLWRRSIGFFCFTPVCSRYYIL